MWCVAGVDRGSGGAGTGGIGTGGAGFGVGTLLDLIQALTLHLNLGRDWMDLMSVGRALHSWHILHLML